MVMRRTDGGGAYTNRSVFSHNSVVFGCRRRSVQKHSHDESEEVEMEAMVPEQVDGEGGDGVGGEGLGGVGVGPVESPAVVAHRESTSESGMSTNTASRTLHFARGSLPAFPRGKTQHGLYRGLVHDS